MRSVTKAVSRVAIGPSSVPSTASCTATCAAFAALVTKFESGDSAFAPLLTMSAQRDSSTAIETRALLMTAPIG
eukprot:4206122-Prymnesium_polylepis.1